MFSSLWVRACMYWRHYPRCQCVRAGLHHMTARCHIGHKMIGQHLEKLQLNGKTQYFIHTLYLTFRSALLTVLVMYLNATHENKCSDGSI